MLEIKQNWLLLLIMMKRAMEPDEFIVKNSLIQLPQEIQHLSRKITLSGTTIFPRRL